MSNTDGAANATPAPGATPTPAEGAPPAPDAPAVVVAPTQNEQSAKPAEVATAGVPSLLGEAKPAETTTAGGDTPKPEEVKPEPKPGEEPKTPEAKTEPKPGEAEQVQPPKEFKYEPFTVPEGVTLDQERVNLLQTVLTEASPDNESAQKLGQSLIDLYVDEVKGIQTAMIKQWSDTQDQWREQVKADPEIGGNRLETALRESASVIDHYLPDAVDRQTVREVLNFTGAGNHPAVIRLFSRIGKTLGEGQPVPANKPTLPAQSRAERRYGGKGAAT